MTITLRPDQELLIAKAMRTGAYSSEEEVIDQALQAWQSDDEWLADQKEEIEAAIETALEQFEKGQFFTPEESRIDMAKRKAEWRLANRS